MSVSLCRDCGSALAPEQRYCISCGLRVAPLGMPSGGVAAPTPRAVTGARKGPPAQVLSMYAAITLGFGVVVGTALDPGLTGLGAVGPQIIQLPGEEAPSTDSGITADTGDSTEPATPTTDTASTGSYAYGSGSSGSYGGGGGGGGGNSKPKPKYLTGTVAQVNPYAESYALAIGNGPLTSVHASTAPETGTTVRVKVVELANGTYAQAAKPEVKRQRRKESGSKSARVPRITEASVEFSGTVSYRDTLRGLYTVSSLGVSVLVHAPDGFLISDIPDVGDLVQVKAKVEDLSQASGEKKNRTDESDATSREETGCNPEPSYPTEPVEATTRLVEESHTVTLTGLTNYSISGIVQRSCEDDGQLVVSADDLNATGEGLSFHPPEEFDLDLVGPGQSFILYLQSDEQGGVEVLGLVSNQGRSGADDDTSAQGVTG